MKKFGLLLLFLFTFIVIPWVRAETADAPTSEPPAVSETAIPEVTPAPVETEAAGETPAAAPNENLEFVSGEVVAADETAKTVSFKLYGEEENREENKTLTVTVDDSTDITDGEKDRDLKSLTAGTEVDVEYDPASNHATYIFVY